MDLQLSKNGVVSGIASIVFDFEISIGLVSGYNTVTGSE
jgi:hypothetical protein